MASSGGAEPPLFDLCSAAIRLDKAENIVCCTFALLFWNTGMLGGIPSPSEEAPPTPFPLPPTALLDCSCLFCMGMENSRAAINLVDASLMGASVPTPNEGDK